MSVSLSEHYMIKRNAESFFNRVCQRLKLPDHQHGILNVFWAIESLYLALFFMGVILYKRDEEIARLKAIIERLSPDDDIPF